MNASPPPQTVAQPLSRHPAFPIAVALWFAALLGMGCYVLPAGLFESAVAATGLDGVVPAARPPLGDTARIAISVVAALIGALFGLFVAGRARAAAVKRDGDPDADTDTETMAFPVEDDAGLEGDSRAPVASNEEPTAWQVWREQMTEDVEGSEAEPEREQEPETVYVDPSYDAPESPAEDDQPAPAFLEDTGDDLSRLDAARRPESIDVGPVAGATYDYDYDAHADADDADADPEEDQENEDPLYDPEADERQRVEADRLVAGLPRLDRHDPVEDVPAHPLAADIVDEPSIETEPEPQEEPEVQPISFAIENEDDEFAPDGPSFDEALSEPEPATEPAPAAPPQDDLPALDKLDTPALIERFERALAAHRDRRSGPRDDGERTSDPVVTLLRRDTAEEAGEDPQTALRSALEKLDRVGRKT